MRILTIAISLVNEESENPARGRWRVDDFRDDRGGEFVRQLSRTGSHHPSAATGLTKAEKRPWPI
jgi:hypothetical protein